MKILFFAMLASAFSLSYASEDVEQYGDWVKSEKWAGYVSKEMTIGTVDAIIRDSVRDDDSLAFGILFPIDTCYMYEKYPEPFGNMLVLGSYNNFLMQCLERGVAVAFPDNDFVQDSIVEELINGNNICLSTDEVKACFSSKGFKDMKEAIKNKS
ncbi:hypothetical protein [Vibrio parahaemolyticus]|uniref:hypothetical protein n=1 Tax=Vibrio parahaemolyticus TaxID=670 RepID=UPI002361BA32|nr:hypothetical protein [Vibrio parahaemolyticus]